MKDIKNKLKSLVEKNENKTSNRKIENIVVFIIILIITIIVINVIWNGKPSENSENKTTSDSNKKLAIDNEKVNNVDSTYDSATQTQNTMETKLADILSNINGVGNVKVMLTYAETSKTMPVYNEESSEENTEETDSEGGTRKITQTDVRKEVIYEEDDNGKTLITQSIISPKIEGAIITANGAGNAEVKTNIIQAVAAVTGLATHKIQVFEMSG